MGSLASASDPSVGGHAAVATVRGWGGGGGARLANVSCSDSTDLAASEHASGREQRAEEGPWEGPSRPPLSLHYPSDTREKAASIGGHSNVGPWHDAGCDRTHAGRTSAVTASSHVGPVASVAESSAAPPTTNEGSPSARSGGAGSTRGAHSWRMDRIGRDAKPRRTASWVPPLPPHQPAHPFERRCKAHDR